MKFNLVEIADIIKDITRSGRELKYEKGEIGITTLISCPKKYKLKQKYGMPEIDSLVIEDGFLFEKVFKKALKKKYGNKFIEEMELIYSGDIKLRGHLDCAIVDGDKVIGIELKHTLITTAPELKSEPPKVWLINPSEDKIKISDRYLLQSRIERYLLEQKFKEVEHYLVIKTTLKGAYAYYKSYLCIPITNSVSDEEFKQIVTWFKTKNEPLFKEECRFCYYKTVGLCQGVEQKETLESKEQQEIYELIDKLEELNKERETIIKHLKKLLRGKLIKYKEKEYGEKTYTSYTYDKIKLAKLLKEKGFRVADYFQISPSKIKTLEELLGSEIEKVRTPVERKKWVGL
jgi:predicted transcriptional regulator